MPAPVTAQAEEEPKELPVNPYQQESKAFSFEDVKRLWEQYTQDFRKKGMKNEIVVMDREFRLEETKIILRLDNVLQQDILNSFRSELLDFLRKNLCNSSIMLEHYIELPPENEKNMLYTDKDKYRYLVEKYPLLDEMRVRLGLDVQF
ncbi:hypothetical protein RCC89_08745 [Cytophagaceae bacterium ABcell3]|nr:hypothetical protein RCC89_08745 [Cytophagaceae bacterium ABcell3]